MASDKRGYSIERMAKEAGVTPRTIVGWTTKGIIEAPTARGPLTRYTEEHLARAREVARLRYSEGLGIPAIRERFAADSKKQAETKARAQAPSESAEWERASLIPGLELRIDPKAGRLARRLMAEIVESYGAGRTGE